MSDVRKKLGNAAASATVASRLADQVFESLFKLIWEVREASDEELLSICRILNDAESRLRGVRSWAEEQLKARPAEEDEQS